MEISQAGAARTAGRLAGRPRLLLGRARPRTRGRRAHAGAAVVVAKSRPDRGWEKRWECAAADLEHGAGVVALTWLSGLLARRRGTLLATAAVALGVGAASVGTFLSATTSRMTERAIGRVRGLAGAASTRERRAGEVRSQPGVEHALAVASPTPGSSASSGGSTQTTGPGRVLALPPHALAGELRLPGLRRRAAAQQTAANLHARPGDLVRIGQAGGSAHRQVSDQRRRLAVPAGGLAGGRAAAGAARQRRAAAQPSSIASRVQARRRVTSPVHGASRTGCRASRAPPTASGAAHATSRPGSAVAGWSGQPRLDARPGAGDAVYAQPCSPSSASPAPRG